MPRITELYAYVMADTGPDDEGVPAFLAADGVYMPMIGADFARAESLHEMAVKLAADSGKPIKLIRSTGIEVVTVIEPQ